MDTFVLIGFAQAALPAPTCRLLQKIAGLVAAQQLDYKWCHDHLLVEKV
jgi:hypothetical protein